MDVPKRPAITASEWRQIVDSALETAIISTDRDGYVTSWNCGAERILGWTEDEMLGQSLERIFPGGESSNMLAREIADALAKGRGGGEENWRLHKDGSRIWAAGEVTPITGDRGEVTGFVKILRNRTYQRQAEEALRRRTQGSGIVESCRLGIGGGVISELEQELVQIVTDVGVELCVRSSAQFSTTS